MSLTRIRSERSRGERGSVTEGSRTGRGVGNDLSIDTTLVNSTTWGLHVYLRGRKGKGPNERAQQQGHRVGGGGNGRDSWCSSQTPEDITSHFFWVFVGVGVMCKSMGCRARAAAVLSFLDIWVMHRGA